MRSSSRRDVLRLDQVVERKRARCQQFERAREAVRVVVVRTEQRELEHDRAVVVHARQFVSGADEDERARVVELVERGFGRAGATRALERDGVGLRDRATHRRARQRLGLDDMRRAQRLPRAGGAAVRARRR